MRNLIFALTAALLLPISAFAMDAQGEVAVFTGHTTGGADSIFWLDLSQSAFYRNAMNHNFPDQYLVTFQGVQVTALSPDSAYFLVEGWHNGLPFHLGTDSVALVPPTMDAGDSTGCYRRFILPPQVDSLRVTQYDASVSGAFTSAALRFFGILVP